MFSNKTKIAFGVILVSVLLNVWQYVGNSSLETSLSEERIKVASLEKDVARLENNAKIDRGVCEAEQESLKKRLDKQEEIRESVSNAKDSLKQIRKGKTNEEIQNTIENGDVRSVNRDIARVLNNACREIFGQDCPNPK